MSCSHSLYWSEASSAGSLILASGKSGHRYALPHAKIMIHQPSGGFSGQATDIKIHAEEILKTKKKDSMKFIKNTQKSALTKLKKPWKEIDFRSRGGSQIWID